MKHRKGDIVEGKIISIKPYGAFIVLDNDETGLLHISEISHDYVKSVDSLLKIGDKVKVKIMDVDTSNNHIIFSRRAITKPRRRTKNKSLYNKNKELISETKKGFDELRLKLPQWIEQYRKGE
ncbi:CvfD/Ygs/GSP13 family RNA-binding post-transcriptional regulator [Mycoplasma sp. P36-A1]|uniref:CvfD/Ygs/GSP13 family RNA-binding post-transcriptional regulator n=1 Tax=Mycoplasma sp. P36-A1 TaxID=3252900 RepID=UPI003C2E121C